MAQVAVAANDASGCASVTVMSKKEIETWASVGEQWGTDIDAAIEAESPLGVKWWRAVMDCPNPDEAREVAHHEQLGTTQIRRRFDVVRHKQPDPPAYRGKATVARCHAGIASFNLDLAEEPPSLAGNESVDLIVKRRAE